MGKPKGAFMNPPGPKPGSLFLAYEVWRYTLGVKALDPKVGNVDRSTRC